MTTKKIRSPSLMILRSLMIHSCRFGLFRLWMGRLDESLIRFEFFLRPLRESPLGFIKEAPADSADFEIHQLGQGKTHGLDRKENERALDDPTHQCRAIGESGKHPQ